MAESFNKYVGFLQRILLKFVSPSAHKYLPFENQGSEANLHEIT